MIDLAICWNAWENRRMTEHSAHQTRYGISIKAALLITLLALVMVIGNWVSFQQTKTMLFRELETRGVWMARNLAYDTWYGVLTHNKGWLTALVDGVIRETDVLYVAIFTKQREMLIFRSLEMETPPDGLVETLKTVCDTPDEPVIHSELLFTHQVYVIDVPVVQQSQSGPFNLGGSFLPGLSGQPDDDAAMPFPSTCLGTIQVGLALHDIDRHLTRLMVIFLLLTAGIVLLGGLSYVIVTRIIVAPILHMADIAHQVAEGDLRPLIQTSSGDEIGVLERALARILSAFRRIAERLQQACDQLKQTSDAMWQMSEELATVSQRHSTSIYQISKNIAATAYSSQAIAANSDNVASIADTTLHAIQHAESTVSQTIMNMQDIRAHTEKNSERALQLGEKIAHIGKVVNIINTIADQTRIIAFNASIEATGAGDAGARFSVVATEVRRLANTAMDALEEIKALVTAIQTATDELILSSETGIRTVNQGVLSITETNQTLQHIMSLMVQTTQTTKDISGATQRQQDEHDSIVAEIQEIADGAEHSVEMSQRATTIANELRSLASELDAVVQQFRT